MEQALEEVMFILSMHWTIQMNFRWWQLQSRIKSAERALQKRHNIPEELCFESYEELLGKEKLADCAMICTMDRMHYEPTIMALKKGYHVLCENPCLPTRKKSLKWERWRRNTTVFCPCATYFGILRSFPN